MKKQTILIVDDEVDIVDNIQQILTQRKKPIGSNLATTRFGAPEMNEELEPFEYEFITAYSGDEALVLLEKTNFQIHCAFLDVKMPGDIDGIELAIRLWNKNPKIYITLVTAYQDRKIADLYQILGHQNAEQWSYINKPFTSAEISQKALQMCLQNKRKVLLEEAFDKMRMLSNQMIHQERNKMSQHISQSVSHEFGNFAQAIYSASEMIDLKLNELSHLDSTSQSVQQNETLRSDLFRYTKVIKSVCENLKTLNQRIQGFNKTTPSHLVQHCDLKQVVLKTIQLCEYLLLKKNLKIRFEHSEATVAVQISSIDLEHVLLNLVMNAIDFSPKNSCIEISIEQIKEQTLVEDFISTSESTSTKPSTEQFIELSIQDQGTGVPSEHQKDLFQWGFTLKGEKGNGIGLSVCKNLLESNRASIRYDSLYTGGARFIIRVPTYRNAINKVEIS